MQPLEDLALQDGLNQVQVNTFNDIWSRVAKTAKPRFSRYANSATDRDGFDPLSRYLWNIALGEALIPTLSGAEIMLKNAIHNSVVQATGDEWWFNADDYLEDGEDVLLERAWRDVQNKMAKRNNPNGKPTADDLVAELSFKFWTGLLNHAYEGRVWAALRTRLANLELPLQNREAFRNAFNRIRELRNRIAHHEPVLHLGDIQQTHALARKIIKGINSPYDRILLVIDRFDEVYAAGPEHYRTRLLHSIRHAPASAFEVRAKEDHDRTRYELADTSLKICAAIFECQGLVTWLVELANTHPRRLPEVAAWHAWIAQENTVPET